MVESLPERDEVQEKATVGSGDDAEENKVAQKLKISIPEECSSRALLEKLIANEPNWQEVMSNATLLWTLRSVEDKEVFDWVSAGPQRIVNRYPGIKELARKDTFASYMRFCSDLDPEAFDFVPPTFQLPSAKDEARFLDYKARNPKAVFIAKPQAGTKGQSISLFKDRIPHQLDGKDIIVQRYLDKPLLLDGIKFDLRVYVVVTGFNPVQAFIYDEGLARFCTARYEAPTQYNFRKAFMHLTNYSVNKMNEEYVRPSADDVLVDNSGTKRTFASLFRTLEAHEIDVERVKDSIERTCLKTMEVLAPLIENQVTALTNKEDLSGKPFQILGFDLLLDRDLKAWVLEINDSPSLNIFFDRSTGLEKEQVELTDEDICPVDFLVKSKLLRDTLKLCKKDKRKVIDLHQYGSLAKIHPPQGIQTVCAINVYSVVRNLRTIFYSLVPPKHSKAQITSPMFQKLHAKQVIKGTGMQKIDMQLAFTATAGSLSKRHLNFIDFCHMMLSFYSHKLVSQNGYRGTFSELISALMPPQH